MSDFGIPPPDRSVKRNAERSPSNGRPRDEVRNMLGKRGFIALGVAASVVAIGAVAVVKMSDPERPDPATIRPVDLIVQQNGYLTSASGRKNPFFDSGQMIYIYNDTPEEVTLGIPEKGSLTSVDPYEVGSIVIGYGPDNSWIECRIKCYGSVAFVVRDN